jgi:CspA family cold shock protein
MNRISDSAGMIVGGARLEHEFDWGGHRMASTTGTIKRKTDKGFGFIAAGDGTEYFFHQSGCVGIRLDDLREGQRVSFTVGQGPKGPRAENVKPE